MCSIMPKDCLKLYRAVCQTVLTGSVMSSAVIEHMNWSGTAATLASDGPAAPLPPLSPQLAVIARSNASAFAVATARAAANATASSRAMDAAATRAASCAAAATSCTRSAATSLAASAADAPTRLGGRAARDFVLCAFVDGHKIATRDAATTFCSRILTPR